MVEDDSHKMGILTLDLRGPPDLTNIPLIYVYMTKKPFLAQKMVQEMTRVPNLSLSKLIN